MLRAIPLCVVLVLSSVTSLHAGDGRIEINEARAFAGGVTAGDAPGFPVTLDQGGSYLLTGNLLLPNENTVVSLAFSRAFLNTSRIFDSVSPTYLLRSSGPLILRK